MWSKLSKIWQQTRGKRGPARKQASVGGLNQPRLASGLEISSSEARGAGGIAAIPSSGQRLSIRPSTPALGIHPHLQGLGVIAVFLNSTLVFRNALLDGHLLITLISCLVSQKALLGLGVGTD